MKKVMITVLIIVFGLAMVACEEKEAMYTPGNYIGESEGLHGYIKVEVTTDEMRIVEIEVLEEYILPEIGEVVFKEIPQNVIEKNSVDVDVVAGATYSSTVLIEAISDALDQALLKSEGE